MGGKYGGWQGNRKIKLHVCLTKTKQKMNQCVTCTPVTGSQKSTSSKSSYGSTVSEYTYSGPDGPPEPGSVAWTPLQVIKEHDTPVSDWSSDNGSRHDVILLDKVKCWNEVSCLEHALFGKENVYAKLLRKH